MLLLHILQGWYIASSFSHVECCAAASKNIDTPLKWANTSPDWYIHDWSSICMFMKSWINFDLKHSFKYTPKQKKT
jgi:hypothetical protein